MGAVYATVEDVELLGRKLTADEAARAPSLLNSASVTLRMEARNRQYDLDEMIAEDEDCGEIARALVVNAVVRALNTGNDTSPAAVQASQSGLGYSASMTYLAPGQTVPFFLKSELKQLGLLKQRYGAMEVYDTDADA